MFSLLLASTVLLTSLAFCAFHAVACVPAIVGVFAIASVRVDHGVPILAGVLTSVLYREAFWTSGLSDHHYRTVIFSSIGLSEYRISDWLILELSDIGP